jgi:hypothetical protein
VSELQHLTGLADELQDRRRPRRGPATVLPMTSEPAPGADLTKSGSPVGTLSDLPSSFPPWATKLAELYFSGTTSAFVLYGNTYDYVRSPAGGDLSRRSQEAKAEEFVGLAEFLAEQLFGRWSLVLHYDLGRGLRVAAGRDEQRLKEMVTLANQKVGDPSTLSKELARRCALDRFSGTPDGAG